MHKLGFHHKCYQKGVYVNGHERPDVIAYYQIFFQKVTELEQLMSKWYDEDCKIRTFPQLVNDNYEEACITMVVDMHHDGFWDAKKLLEQVKWTINIFERTHSKCIFAFNNVTSHTAFAEDALVASKMNLGPGGSVSKMQNTHYKRSSKIENNNKNNGDDEPAEGDGQLNLGNYYKNVQLVDLWDKYLIHQYECDEFFESLQKIESVDEVSHLQNYMLNVPMDVGKTCLNRENARIRKKGPTSFFQSSFRILEEENEENLVDPIWLRKFM
ncbi:hypothetical protein Glove_527g16 [Diversispora epigaea]|uniref:Uncharacterized protein n=1 Tax=Diversispora epigaea TaxID=1348612 RepID=A0A397GGG7_9GLOM|nr:hypothetical protein Glove_527g16 [Diversispora epigaea]